MKRNIASRLNHVALLLIASAAFAAVAEDEPVTVDDELDPAEWGIHNSCISLNRIRAVRVKSDHVVFLELYGGKKVMMTFTRPCRGLKYNGYIHSTRTKDLCAKFDSIRVIERGNVCLIDSLEPVIELDDTQLDNES